MGAKLNHPDADMLKQAVRNLCIMHTGKEDSDSGLIPFVLRTGEGTVDEVIYLDPQLSADGTKVEKIILTPESYYSKYKKFYDAKESTGNGCH